MIKVADIDRLVDFLSLKPYRASYRVAVINDADNMHPAAANGLLKIMEDLLGSNLIVLCTSEESLIPSTVLSRAIPLRFGPLSPEETLEILKGRGSQSPFQNDLKRMAPYMGRSVLVDFTVYTRHIKDMVAFLTKFPTMEEEELLSLVDELDAQSELGQYLDVMARCIEDIVKFRQGAYDQISMVSRLDQIEAVSQVWKDDICLAMLDRLKMVRVGCRKPLNLKLKHFAMPALLWPRFLFELEEKKDAADKKTP
jgi:hypothetical protein